MLYIKNEDDKIFHNTIRYKSLMKLEMEIRHIHAKFILRRTSYFRSIKKSIHKKNGLEVGGPTTIFHNNGEVPIYQHINSLDSCNFSHNTIWEGKLKEGPHFYYNNSHIPGHQYIDEADTLYKIQDNKYDFVLSSHCLEHIANPLKALKNWARVINTGGHLLVLIPWHLFCFDHIRPITPFKHLQEDFEKNITEDDMTHLSEFLKVYKQQLFPFSENEQDFKFCAENNHQTRSIHHHVFDLSTVNKLILSTESLRPLFIRYWGTNIVALCIKENLKPQS